MNTKMIWLFAFLVSIEVNAQNNKDLLNAHFQKLTNAKSYALDILNSMNDDKLNFKPVKEEMSFKEQIIHIGENIYWLSSTYLKEESKQPLNLKSRLEGVNKKELYNFLSEAYDYALETIKNLDESTLSKEFKWRDGKLNKLQFLNLIQDHQSHHVGQLIVYLRLNNIEPPKYIGW
ncbi:MAG: hypothetical protein RLZ10_884 [Bacteroidota bacterium]|jgi:uncharacterized damage-inducible protein DinB